MNKNKLLINLLLKVAQEIEKLLKDDGNIELTDKISGLVLYDRCRCNDSFCSSLYLVPKPENG